MLGFMLTSWFVSMWMNNAATTSMLLPIVESVLAQIEESGDEKATLGTSSHSHLSTNCFIGGDYKFEYYRNPIKKPSCHLDQRVNDLSMFRHGCCVTPA